jgi:hypothetical protein
MTSHVLLLLCPIHLLCFFSHAFTRSCFFSATFTWLPPVPIITTTLVPAARVRIFLPGKCVINSLQVGQEEMISTPVKQEKKKK